MSAVDPHSNPQTAGMSEAASLYLDGLRALGANLVVAAHVLYLYFGVKAPYLGSLGVALFFLLSGYLIMQSMLNRAQRPGVHLPGFLADRTARILTPYVPALVLIALTNVVLVQNSYGAPGAKEGSLAFLGNLLLLQDHSVFQALEIAGLDVSWRIRPYMTAEPFWTVAIEMWIYVAVGLFFFCALRREPMRRSIVIALALVSFPVVLWNAAAGGGDSLTIIWLLGAVAGLLFHEWRKQNYARSNLIAAIVVVLGIGALGGRVANAGFHAYDVQTAVLIAFVMFGTLAFLMRMNHVPKFLQRTCGFLASYSYSLYLLHNTVLIVILETLPIADVRVRAITAVVLAHLISYALYVAFERHYRVVGKWLKPHFERVLTRRSERRALEAHDLPVAATLPDLMPKS